jgi:phosphoribosylanthranilate isomerase
MFRIKICGITNEADGVAASDAGADAVGLNFFRKSRRFVEPDIACQIAAAMPAGMMRVGVFVNHSVDEIANIVQTVGLDCVQLHGDEPATRLVELPTTVKIVRAYRCGNDGLGPLAKYLDECRRLGRVPDAVLIDADAGEDYGGSGARADWARISAGRELLGGVQLVLAGGLGPGNVATAIAAVRPDAVDVASGVELRPGQKDASLVQRFVAEASAALARNQKL